MYGTSVETLDDRVGTAFDAAVETLCKLGPIAPSCRKANESKPLGFVILDGRGGGVRRPFRCETWDGTAFWLVPTSAAAGLKPSDIPIASKL
jgi:hypothetical protein